MSKEYLRVYANPWLHVDHEGRPCCAVARTDAPEIPGEMRGRWVGATPKITVEGESVTVGTLTGYVGGEPSHEVEWEFTDEAQLVPNFGSAGGYYRDRIREGALVLADAADAKRLGIKRWVVGGKQELVPCGKQALTPNPKPSKAEEKH